jgi:hypothetical protein
MAACTYHALPVDDCFLPRALPFDSAAIASYNSRIFSPPTSPCTPCTCPQSALAKERRELQQQQQRTLLEAIPKDLSRPWEDPMPEEGERHLAAVSWLCVLR